MFLLIADIDECKGIPGIGKPCDGNHGTCTNYPGSYACGCETGFALQPNKVTCKGMYYVCIWDNYDLIKSCWQSLRFYHV